MKPINEHHTQKATKRPLSHTTSLSAALCGALTVAPGFALAQSTGVAELAPVQVTGSAPDFKVDHVQSVKFQAPLVDTPQTISIVPSEVLEQQGAQSLQDVLRNVPGITFSSGEGGAGWGDMFTIRGFSAEQSITVDGVRDSQLSTRTDLFNLEQAEVYKGTGSIESGVAAVGGSVNLVSKTPHLGSLYRASLGAGTDQYRRATVDINHQLGESTAFRINAMGHHNRVAGRGPTEFERWGFAPSLSFGLGTPTRATLSYFHQKDKNIPDFGVPVGRDGERMQYISRDYWGGLKNADTEETEVDAFDLNLEHDFTDKASIRNHTRWSQTKRFTYLTTGGRLLNAPGATHQGQIIPGPGGSNYWGYDGNGNEVYPSGYWAVARLFGNTNAYRGKIFANQTDLNLDFQTGAIRHRMVTGVEYYQESYRKDPYSRWLPDIGGGRYVIDARNPDTRYSGPWANKTSTDSSGAEVTNLGVYAYDQITLTPQWEVAAGLRHDRYKVKWYEANGQVAPYRQSDGIWSGRLGLIYKPAENGSVYLSYSRASQPSAAAAASRDGGAGTSGRGQEATVTTYSPGVASTWELGTKWELFDRRLLATAALFQVERSNPSDTDDEGNPTQRAAKERVRGLELGLAGSITPRWSAYAGAAFMRSKILEDAADPLQAGGKMKNVPDMTFNLWTTYDFTDQFAGSLGAQYIGKRRFVAGNRITDKGGHSSDVYAPSYWVANAALSYRAHKNLNLRLNVNNLFDTFYYQQVSSSSDGFQLFGVPGAGRTVILSAEASF
ncbi:TonB-dependent siderophore receptor [Castellaniella ginsengisoli]|jgi:catecholate siderophore receptor|uniref:TonB-dependent siderophore receptor n=1 Tax=Castellaniella ginsengisoli TaxID=546114 RepID=A0AB39H3Y2_9BURK